MESELKIAKIQYRSYLRGNGRGGEGSGGVWKGDNKKNVEDLI
jgi:hypothetical protein